MLSDDELYNMFLDGDTASYDELMIRYGDSLIMYLNGYLHNWQDSEDLMIEAFARIMVKRPSIKSGGFKAYLYKTARNLASRFHSILIRRETFSLDDEEGSALEAAISTGDQSIPSPEEILQDNERNRILHSALQKIDRELQEVLWLVYFEEMSYADAAKVMNVNRKRVDHLLQRGKKVLREELEKAGIKNAFE